MTAPILLDDGLRTALATEGLGVWSWTPSSDEIALDERAAELLGVDASTRTMAELIALLPQDQHTAWLAALDASRTAAGRANGLSAIRLKAGDGTPRELALRVVTSSGVARERVVGLLRDVTTEAAAIARASQSEARYASILSIAADAIVSIDERHHITLFNQGAEHIFGYSAVEVLGQPLDVLLPERYRAAHRGQVQRFAASPVQARRMGERAPIYGRRKSGDEFPAEASISQLQHADGKIFAVVLRDITERMRAQDALARSHADLEQRVAERTAALSAEIQRREDAQAQLVRSQRMEAFGQLTGGVAHDFNNLLTVITGNLELLEMRLQDERNRTLLKRARDAADMGARLTSRLLTFARRRKLEIATLDLNEELMAMTDLLQRAIGEHIELSTHLEPRLWHVRADPSEIENAILNLAINARDAMAKGGRVEISTSNVVVDTGTVGTIGTLPAGDYVRISVSDTGIGMSPDVLRRAFEPFFTTKQPGKGTGLGLSTIYGFLQQLGGTATIESEVGLGTTVSIYLPRGSSDAATMEPDVGEIVPVSGGEVVLLVEDSADVREVTQSRLAGLGYEVRVAENGPQAIEMLSRGNDVDIVFSDVMMAGGLSGFDVARWVRRERPAVKVLLTSGYPDESLRGAEPGIEDLRILRKPYSRLELARALRQALEK